MKLLTKLFGIALLALFGLLSACHKPDIFLPGNGGGKPGNGGTNNPGNPIPEYVVNVKAVIGIGSIVYDSIPATLFITSWDSNNVVHEKQVSLKPGTNPIALNKSHLRYNFKLTQWGITGQRAFTKAEVAEGSLITLGGSREARKLKLEEKFLLAAGEYRPDGKSVYSYNTDGTLNQIEFYQKRPQHADLKLYYTDRYHYISGKLEKISRFDQDLKEVGVTNFFFQEGGRISNMQEKIYDRETGASVDYAYENGNGSIQINYLFSNGHAMEYNMTFKGGNKVQEEARTSTGGGEGGTFTYDFNINPFAHMNMPNMYLSNMSINNMTGQQKSYGGNIPSTIPYKYEYRYDDEGYPVELIRSFKSPATNTELYKIKTVFTYL